MTTELVTRESCTMTPAEIASVSDTPSKLLALAIANQTPPETLAKLMDLQERWQANVARQEYVHAMSEFKKAAPPAIIKQSKVDFTSGKGRTHYNYANLGDVVQQITPLLAKHGLHAAWETATPKDGPISVTCHVTHSAGHRESVTLSGPADNSGNKNAIQAIGSCVTYLQRYTLLAALGLATMEDDDGRGGPEATNGNKTEPEQQTDSTNANIGPWWEELDKRDTLPKVQHLLHAAEADGTLPVKFINAVRAKVAAMTPDSAATIEPAKAPTPPVQAQQQTAPPANAATPEAIHALTLANGGKFPWKAATPDQRTCYAVIQVKAAGTLERVAAINKGIKESDVGPENYRRIQQAMTAREAELSKPEGPGEGPDADPTEGLAVVLADKSTAAEFDEMARRWNEDSHSIDEPTYNKGVEMIRRARISKGV